METGAQSHRQHHSHASHLQQRIRISQASVLKLSEYKASAGSPKTVRVNSDMPFKAVMSKSAKRKNENSQPNTARLILNRDASIENIVNDFEILQLDEVEIGKEQEL